MRSNIKIIIFINQYKIMYSDGSEEEEVFSDG
jgi:hypothetical protein